MLVLCSITYFQFKDLEDFQFCQNTTHGDIFCGLLYLLIVLL